MYELIYMSSATHSLSEGEINQLLVKARRFNFDHSITGVLLYIDGDFIQILEGRKEVISELFERIKKDSRHENIIVIHEGEKPKRQFPDWSMGFHCSTYERLRKIPGLADFSRRDLSSIEEMTTVSFLESFINKHQEKISFR